MAAARLRCAAFVRRADTPAKGKDSAMALNAAKFGIWSSAWTRRWWWCPPRLARSPRRCRRLSWANF